MQDLIDYNLSPIPNEEICNNCNAKFTDTCSIKTQNQLVVVQLIIFETMMIGTEFFSWKKTDFILNDPSNDIIITDNKAFKIHGSQRMSHDEIVKSDLS